MNSSATSENTKSLIPSYTETDEDAVNILKSGKVVTVKAVQMIEIFRQNLDFLERQRNSIQLLQKENKLLTESNDKLLAEVDKSTTKQNKLVEKCNKFKKNLEAIILIERELESKVTILEKEKISLTSNRTELINRVSTLQKEITRFSQDLNTVEDQKNTLEHNFRSLNQENGKLKTDNARLTADQLKAEEDLAALEKEKECFQSCLEAMRIKEARKTTQNSFYKEMGLRAVAFTSVAAMGLTLPIGLLLGATYILIIGRDGGASWDMALDKFVEEASKDNGHIPKAEIYEKAAELSKKSEFSDGMDSLVNVFDHALKLIKESKWF